MGRGQELLDAAREGDRKTVEKIIGQISKRSGPFTSLLRGAGVNVQDDNGYTPLHHACLHGNKEIVRLLLSVDASPCIVDKKGATPLHLAAFKGDYESVQRILAHNNPPANIDAQTSDHETALLIAAQFGFVDIVAALIEKGADVSIKNISDESPLDLAAQYGRLKTVEYLLKVKPHLVDPYKPPMSKGKVYPTTPLNRASKNGRKEVVAVLIAAGVDPNIRTYEGTPLHEAARYNRPSVVRVLLKSGADLNLKDRRGNTVYELLREYPEEATRRLTKVIREYGSQMRPTCDSDEDVPPFPTHDCSPTPLKGPETQKKTNTNESLLSPSSSSITKNHHQSFVKKLASKCLGLKAKFNSAPNISNNAGLETEVDVKSKHENKSSMNTLLIGNSKFFKILSKKEDSGEIVCNYEFDTISLDRAGTLNRDSVVNRSNRSCPGFKTSLPNISENNELSDSQESIGQSTVTNDLHINNVHKNKIDIVEAVNLNTNIDIFEPRDRVSIISGESANFVNEYYESFEFSKHESEKIITSSSLPRPAPRPNGIPNPSHDSTIYENVVVVPKTIPKPAARTNLPPKLEDSEKIGLYENINLIHERKPQPPKRNILPPPLYSNTKAKSPSPNVSRSSTLSTDSMVDESNLEDIFLSQKSKSFRHAKIPSYYSESGKLEVYRTRSNSSDSSDGTEASAIENVDCSEELLDKSIYLSMTGTLPNKKTEKVTKKKVLFRHKTFTNIEVDRDSIKVRDLPQWNNEFLKETLAHYHIRGTGHCIYKAPTVTEFLNFFNRDTLGANISSLKGSHNKRDSYYETAICFCKPRPLKNFSSAENLLDIPHIDDDEKVVIDFEAFNNQRQLISASFRCFCETGTCALNSKRLENPSDFVVKFSAIKKSISTPDITLDTFPSSTIPKYNLPKNNSVPHNLEDPYAVVNVDEIVARSNCNYDKGSSNNNSLSHTSTLSSNFARPYSIKDISEVISMNSTSTTSSQPFASENPHLPLRKSSSSEYSGNWSLHSCNSNASNVTISSSFKSCIEESSEEDSDGTLHSDADSSDAETVKSDVSTGKRPWVHSDSFRFGGNSKAEKIDVIVEENAIDDNFESSSKVESGISVEGSESSSSGGDDDSGVPRVGGDVSLDTASLERGPVAGGVRSGSGRRRWDEAEGTSEGDALSVSSAASSCAPLHLHNQEYSKVSGAKHYLKLGRSVDHYVESKLSYSEYEENHNSPRVIPIPNPRPSLKQRSQPVAITAMYENVVIKEQNPRRKLRRNNFLPGHENFETRMNDNRVRKYSNQERSSLESLLDDQSMNSPSECDRYSDGHRMGIPMSPTHYEQPPTPDHPPPSARQAENSIHEKIRPLSQLIMEVVEEIRIRKKTQGDIANS